MKKAIVVGLSSEVGLALAEKLIGAGIKVAGSYHTRKTLIEDLETRYPERVKGFKLNLETDPEKNLKPFLAQALEFLDGDPDYGLYLAGKLYLAPFIEEDFKEVETLWRLNYWGAYHFFRFLTPLMVKKGEGILLAVASISGVRGSALEISYSATKAALVSLCLSLADELANTGVRVLCVSPGFIKTERIRQLLSPYHVKIVAKNAFYNRLPSPREVAQFIFSLLETPYLTRVNFPFPTQRLSF